MTDLTALLTLAVDTAVEAGELVSRLRRVGVEVADTKSSAVDVVTEADRASEQLIRDRILSARPDDGFLGEEDTEVLGSSGVRWVVDPIDGTVNYLYGDIGYAVSIAAEVEGRTVVGVVHQPETGQTFSAVEGGGAHRDGTPIRVRDEAPLSQRLVLTGFGYDAELRGHQGAAVARMLPQVRDIRRRGSCALDLCAVAAGEADAYVEEGPNAWDHAAGSLIVTEAGGRFDLLPSPRGKGVVTAATRRGFDSFVQLLRTSGFVGEQN